MKSCTRDAIYGVASLFLIACGGNDGQPTSDDQFDSETGSFANSPNVDTQTDSSIVPPDTSDEIDSDTARDTDVSSNTDTTDTEVPEDCDHPEVSESCEEGWCRIEPGCFLYGSYPTEPCRAAHSEEQVYVTLTRPYVIAQTEVTQTQWEEMGLPNPSLPPACAECPITMINWYDTLVYLNALSEREGLEKCYGLSCCAGEVASGCLEGDDACMDDGFFCDCEINRFSNVYECPGYRLPTAAEWEYAARAGTTTETYIGDSESDDYSHCVPDPLVDRIAWYCGNTETAMPVGQKEKNGWGLYDMLGNVYEWASDPYNNTPYGKGESHITDPYGFVDGVSARRSRKSGCFVSDSSCIRSAKEIGGYTSQKSILEGFRPVRTLIESPK